MPPVAFISYSRASERHIAWVTDLSRRLRANGVDVQFDRWNVRPGHDLDLFMERYGDSSARVVVVLSDDYGPKADNRGERDSGVGIETAIVSRSVYHQLGGNRVIPIVPDSGAVADNPVLPIYLGSRLYIDFRGRYEDAYEELLRELHGAPVDIAPPLGPNPFVGTTQAQSRAAIRNDPARWHDSRTAGALELNLNENNGHFTLGGSDTRFDLQLDYPYEAGPGGPQIVRHYRDRIDKIGLISAAANYTDRFVDLTAVPLSNRVEQTRPGDVLVMANQRGYWALLILDSVTFRLGTNGYEPIAAIRFVIATDRTAGLTLDDLPTAAGSEQP